VTVRIGPGAVRSISIAIRAAVPYVMTFHMSMPSACRRFSASAAISVRLYADRSMPPSVRRR
jgi:hypothetical protein